MIIQKNDEGEYREYRKFELGLSDSEILSFLALSHHVIKSISTLKRKLRSMRLSRKKDFSDLLEVALIITQELE